jgi:phosphatidylserine/phosphatidylglycerophosphate/cardiolipin synthase-like enzyme/uncharacterized membrane protein YdjX (TVP38/TMEM64 family)
MKKNIFKPDINCQQTAKADQVTLLIDYADYYRAIFKAIKQAKHSIFIIGWDIDGRIELLRGEEANNAQGPITLFDLINAKAKENPDLKIYLSRWNYSIFFLEEREPFSGLKWHKGSTSNVYFYSDYKIPFSACHHQKVVIVDDSIAFCGGMDITIKRWDERTHLVNQPLRVDPGGLTSPKKKKPYKPTHDTQIMVTGPVVKILSELARYRWMRGAGFEAVTCNTESNKAIWPAGFKPDFYDIEVAVSRTLPKTLNTPASKEILRMYLDEIEQAEHFIYIENQFLTCEIIAHALNKQLQEKPALKILVVSCAYPRGYLEHKAMWSWRTKFYDIVSNGIDPGRFEIVYPLSQEHDQYTVIDIHSKIMMVDDKYMHVGSSNLNNRSMHLDTECDLILHASRQQHREKIQEIRDDLISEHTGKQKEEIRSLIDSKSDIHALIKNEKGSHRHLLKIDNEPYRGQKLARLAIKLGDPLDAFIPANMPVMQIIIGILLITLIAFPFVLWLEIDLSQLLTKENVDTVVENARNSKWSLLWVVGLYILSSIIFFPVTVLNITIAIAFGPVYGFFLALLGSMITATVFYGIGRMIGEKAIHIFRPVTEKIRQFEKKGGIMGMTLIRLVPIAPFTLVNMTFGISRVSFSSYELATLLGFLPSILANAVFGAAIGELWEDPDPQSIAIAGGALLLWGFVIWLCHRLFKYFHGKFQS